MVTRRLEVCVITENLGASGVLGQALLFPDLFEFDSNTSRVASVTARQAARVFRSSSRLSWWQRAFPGLPELQSFSITLHPPRSSDAAPPDPANPGDPDADDTQPPESIRWLEPLTLTWPVLCYSTSDTAMAFIPALGIQAIAPDAQALAAKLPDEALAALRRDKRIALGFELAYLAQRSQARLHAMSMDVVLKTPRQLLEDQGKKKNTGPTELEKVSTVLHDRAQKPAFELDKTIDQIAQALVGPPGQSVLLVGPSGVGKSAAIRELANSRQALHLGDTPFYLTSGSRLVAGMSGFGMWQERCLKICQDAIKQNAVLILGNLMELMEVGKSMYTPQGLASYFAPYCQRGQIRAIVECTPEQLQLIQRREPRLAEAFLHIQVTEPTPQACRKILDLATAKPAADREVLILPDSLDTTLRLHQRYAGYSTNPGRPLNFLTTLLSAQLAGATITPDTVVTAFTAQTGLPKFMLDDNTPMDPAHVHDWFQERVIGQAQPVAAVVAAMARAKARLTRPGRPIASLFFIGPTGVGKTETAKALAQFLYSTPDRMVRIDMSEYADPWAAGRLAGNTAGSEGYLTSRVREQPFGVILLDEFEKAHPDVFDLLLQVLGEGRLTDAAGRLADFSNSVIIMTSNLGAQTYSQSGFGFSPSPDARAQAAAHFTQEVRKRLRPELFNRIDAVVPFAPLDQATATAITRRELGKALMRDGILSRNITIDLSDHAATELARAGFDVRYGARPLKRAIQERLMAPLAQGINHYPPALPLHASITWADSGLQVTVKAATPTAPSSLTASPGQIAQQCLALRRAMQNVRKNPAYTSARNHLFQLTRENDAHLKRLAKVSRLAMPPGVPNKRLLAELARNIQIQEKLKPLQTLLDTFESLQNSIHTLEEFIILALCQRSPLTPPETTTLASHSDAWETWLADFYFGTQALPKNLTLLLFAQDHHWLSQLARSYLAAIPKGAQGRLMQLFIDFDRPVKTPKSSEASFSAATRPVFASLAPSIDHMLDRRPGTIGVAIEVTGPRAAALFANEDGIHALALGPKTKQPCLVKTTTQSLDPDLPAAPGEPVDLSGLLHDVTRTGALAGVPETRILSVKNSALLNIPDGQSIDCPDLSLQSVLGPWLQQSLRARFHTYAGATEPRT